MEKKEGKKEAPDILFTSSFQKKSEQVPGTRFGYLLTYLIKGDSFYNSI